MSDPVRFLYAFAHVLGVSGLYAEGHPSRERAVDAAFVELEGLGIPSTFTFLDEEVVFGRERIRGLKSWDWGRRLVAAGIQRIEVERRVSREEFDAFLQEVFAQLSGAGVETTEARQMRSLGIRFGPVDLGGAETIDTWVDAAATLDVMLGEEAETFRWLLSQVQSKSDVPLLEAQAVVRALSVAMHGGSAMILPLLKLKQFDQYTTTHSLNVAVLAMALAEAVGFGPADIRTIGVSGLLHDIGKIRIPLEVLTKPGKLTPEERAIMQRHPSDGARILLHSDDDFSMASVVAYEHHIMLNGEGYPFVHYRRPCAVASRLVHVCDVFDALGTDRPYRDAWETQKILLYLEGRAGTEFDSDLVNAFVRTMRHGQMQVRVLVDDRPAQGADEGPPSFDSARPPT
jgi:putative nucleotidyltransferase with HDIG domain